jgi:hypothetical protein
MIGTPLESFRRVMPSFKQADEKIPYEDGYSAEAPHRPVSYWRDTVFIRGMTAFNGRWYAYYGGSECSTCLATAFRRK